MKVAIIGGGIGGLTLAHALMRAGVEVSVHERDAHAGARWEGYRIHVDPNGVRALTTCLPAGQLAALRASASHTNDFTMTTEHLRVLISMAGDKRWPPVDGVASHFGVDRAVLRRVLLTGLEPVVRFGAGFVAHRVERDGRVTARFADDSEVTADLLVGADGAGSRLARALLPGHPPRRSGALAIVQRIPLTESAREWVPEVLTRGMTVTCPAQPGFMFTAAFCPPPGAAAALAETLGTHSIPPVAPYLVVSLVLDAAHAPAGIETMTPAQLHEVGTRFVADWHPMVGRLVAAAEPAARRVLVFRACDPLPSVPWTDTPVTLLGDAVHQMPPVGGLGGNTALRDAAHLADTIVTGGELREYETTMLGYAATAVRDALKMQAQNLAKDGLFTVLPRMFYAMSKDIPAVDRIGAISS